MLLFELYWSFPEKQKALSQTEIQTLDIESEKYLGIIRISFSRYITDRLYSRQQSSPMTLNIIMFTALQFDYITLITTELDKFLEGRTTYDRKTELAQSWMKQLKRFPVSQYNPRTQGFESVEDLVSSFEDISILAEIFESGFIEFD